MEEPYEVEVKLPIASMESIEETIIQAGGVRLNSETQSDIYFDYPCRSFSETDESIRLRHRTPLGDSSLSDSGYAPIELTYKGVNYTHIGQLFIKLVMKIALSCKMRIFQSHKPNMDFAFHQIEQS